MGARGFWVVGFRVQGLGFRPPAWVGLEGFKFRV
jgi:hypothetical protein